MYQVRFQKTKLLLYEDSGELVVLRVVFGNDNFIRSNKNLFVLSIVGEKCNINQLSLFDH